MHVIVLFLVKSGNDQKNEMKFFDDDDIAKTLYKKTLSLPGRLLLFPHIFVLASNQAVEGIRVIAAEERLLLPI